MQKETTIKPWYKKVPHAGIIPEDWSIVKLWDIWEFKNWVSKWKEDFWFWYWFINLMDVFWIPIINSNKDLWLVNVNEKDLENYSLNKWDILFIRSSVKPSWVWLTTLVDEDIKDTVYSWFIIRFREKEKVFSHYYKKHCFFESKFRNNLMAKSSISANTNINQDSLSNLYLAIPKIEEQEEIANILNNCDNKIDILKKIIQKIELRNKGLQQQLLTWKKRLDWFSLEWNELQLNDCLNYVPRWIPKPLEKYLALWIRSHGKWIFHKPDSDPKNIAMDELFVVKENDLVVNITFAWEQAIAIASKNDEWWLVSHRFPTYTFKRDIAIHEYFKYLIIQNRFKYMLDLISPGWAWRNRVLSKKEFLKMKVNLPSVEEQKAIADVLNKATEQLDFYKQKLEKLELEKKGLMQQLLTGKIRVKI